MDGLLSALSGAFVEGRRARGRYRRLRGFWAQRGLVLFGLSRQPWGAPAAFRESSHAGGDRRAVLPWRTAPRRPRPEPATRYTGSVRIAVQTQPGGWRQVARRG